ncbi:DUF2339 domain-containing protein [Polaribacter sp.]|nr:DUF2339 domain-containing protein [Polaribacter sp.]
MEAILFIITIIFLIVIYNRLNTNFSKLEHTIYKLNVKIQNLTQKITDSEISKKQKEVAKEIIKPIVVEKPIVDIPKVAVAPILANASKISQPIQSKTGTNTVTERPKKKVPKKSLWENFKEKNPDLEKFIGENLINKLGILILVLGISFLVKYAIDKDWITEPARVGIGILSGALVMAIAHKLKKNYAAFSAVLVAGAISVFYFTIYLAFHEYQLFNQTVAFSIMVVITAFSTLVSVSYNRQELAVLSLIGGFSVPFMLSTGEGNYLVLFTYIAILNIGILGVSYFKKWKIATILAFIFTTLLYLVWLLTSIGKPAFSHIGALVFATVFYFIFSITIVLSNLRNKGKFTTIEYLILIANTFFFFGMGMMILRNWDAKFTGLFTLLLAVYNLVYATILYKKFGLEKNAVYLFVGLALTFVTLTIPIQFDGNHITLFWAAEAVLLLWLFQKSKINSFKIGAIVVQILSVISLLIDWTRYLYSEDFSIAFNPLFIAGLVVVISLLLTYKLLQKETSITDRDLMKRANAHKTIVMIAAIVVAYFVGILETQHQANQSIANSASALSLSVTYHFVFISFLLYFNQTLKREKISKIIMAIGVVSVFFYLVKFYDLPSREIVENFVENTNSQFAFIFHYLILGCLVYFGTQFYHKTNGLFNTKPQHIKLLPWLFVFAVVFVLSNEIMIHSLYFLNPVDTAELAIRFPSSLENMYGKGNFVNNQVGIAKTQIVKIGYPILWGVFSFVFLIIGIKKEWKNLRIIALSLLGITVVKLFMYDIKNVSETGKIIAFILLGILILVISFVYQKIKKLVVEETKEKQTEDEKI